MLGHLSVPRPGLRFAVHEGLAVEAFVDPVAAEEVVDAEAAVEEVVAVSALEGVVTISAFKMVISYSCSDSAEFVVGGVSDQDVPVEQAS